MSRTDLDPATLACSLRRMAGDGSVEWVMEPIQAAVLHDIADMLDENAKLRELIAKYSAAAKYLCRFSHCNECNLDCASVFGDVPSGWDCARMLLDKRAREMGVEVDG